MSDSIYTPEQRKKHINRLVRSFDAMSTMDKAICKHAMAAPTNNPETGKPFESFREVMGVASDHTIDTLLFDFESNELLLPEDETLDNPPAATN